MMATGPYISLNLAALARAKPTGGRECFLAMDTRLARSWLPGPRLISLYVAFIRGPPCDQARRYGNRYRVATLPSDDVTPRCPNVLMSS
jgi:hypothetical protein